MLSIVDLSNHYQLEHESNIYLNLYSNCLCQLNSQSMCTMRYWTDCQQPLKKVQGVFGGFLGLLGI